MSTCLASARLLLKVRLVRVDYEDTAGIAVGENKERKNCRKTSRTCHWRGLI